MTQIDKGPDKSLGKSQRRKAPPSSDDDPSQNELLATILAHPGGSEMVTAELRAIVDRFGSVGALLVAPFGELASETILGPRGAGILRALRKLLVEGAFAAVRQKPLTSSFRDLIIYLQWALGRSVTRDVYLIYANDSLTVTHSERVASDVVDVNSCRIADLVSAALRANAHRLILAMNNPMGDPEPSADDIDFVREFRDACCLLSIVLLDFVVVWQGDFYSARQAGCI